MLAFRGFIGGGEGVPSNGVMEGGFEQLGGPVGGDWEACVGQNKKKRKAGRGRRILQVPWFVFERRHRRWDVLRVGGQV